MGGPSAVICGVILMWGGYTFGQSSMVGCGVFLLLVGVVMVFIGINIHKKIKEEKKQAEIAAEEAKATEAKRKFYQDCRAANIYEIDTEEKRQKAILLARRYGLETSNVDELYREAAQMVMGMEEAERQRKFEERKQEEKTKYAELTQYAEFVGRDKRLKMLTDMQLEYVGKLQKLGALGGRVQSIANASMQREKDWAVHGGIASGIAGGAAGLATAMDIQAQNAQIRANNEAIGRASAMFALKVAEQKSSYERIIERYEKDIQEAETKLVSGLSAEELMPMLSVKVSDVQISDTGAFTVKAEIAKQGTIKAFEDLQSEAVIDGTISADFYQNGSKVGSALLVLPTYGIGSPATVEGICLSGAVENVPYKVRFTPYHLWAMER